MQKKMKKLNILKFNILSFMIKTFRKPEIEEDFFNLIHTHKWNLRYDKGGTADQLRVL